MVPFLRSLLDLLIAFAGPRAKLVAENLLLRQQVINLQRGDTRLRLRTFDRWLIGGLAGGFRGLLDAVLVVKPETVIRWHRAGWRLFWRRRSRSRLPGRPPVNADLRALIRHMWCDNVTWGEDRIVGELAKPGTRIRATPILGGLHHRYGFEAALTVSERAV